MKSFLKVILRAIILLVVIFVVFLIWATLTDYKPAEVTAVEPPISGQATVFFDSSEFSLLIWNIGYCGLDKSMDFFYDGGKQVRPGSEGVAKNVEGVRRFLSNNYKDLDFLLIQEIDKDSKRSYNTNIFELLAGDLNGWHPAFATNYKAGFVPLPPTNPMGKVFSGLATFSKHVPDSQARYDFPGSYSWPTRLFMLDRCFLVQRYPVENGKELLIINTHNSAYDDGSLKAAEMEYLHKFLLAEYEKGNYVLVGGDWNQCAPGFEPLYDDQPLDTVDLKYIPRDFLPEGWTWSCDPRVPSNRRVSSVYEPGQTPTTVIDYFLTSPNISVTEVRGINLMFEFSDHNPVLARIRLN